MDQLDALLRIGLAAVAGAIIGIERETRHKPAGIRTYSIVSLGAATFVLVGIIAFGGGDPGSRIAATIITGVGFLGAGAILKDRGDVIGLTTAAGIWGAAAVGMAFGTGLLLLGAGATIIMLVVLRLVGGVREASTEDSEDAD
jgi:putative Mg2+ transporter-C (MgtC) family protein